MPLEFERRFLSLEHELGEHCRTGKSEKTS